MSNLKFALTLEKLNIILAGLGELPAKTSSAIITKIQDEAKKQIKPIDGDKIDPKQELKLEFSVDEVNLILAALGELPAKVSMQLIEGIKTEAEGQIKKMEEKSSPSSQPTETTVETTPTHHTSIPVSNHSENREVEVKSHDFE